jgi:hypothetical protein
MIAQISEGLDTFKNWSDLDLLNNKDGWENLGIANSTLLSRVCKDAYEYTYPIRQTMADIDSML